MIFFVLFFKAFCQTSYKKVPCNTFHSFFETFRCNNVCFISNSFSSFLLYNEAKSPLNSQVWTILWIKALTKTNLRTWVKQKTSFSLLTSFVWLLQTLDCRSRAFCGLFVIWCPQSGGFGSNSVNFTESLNSSFQFSCKLLLANVNFFVELKKT